MSTVSCSQCGQWPMDMGGEGKEKEKAAKEGVVKHPTRSFSAFTGPCHPHPLCRPLPPHSPNPNLPNLPVPRPPSQHQLPHQPRPRHDRLYRPFQPRRVRRGKLQRERHQFRRRLLHPIRGGEERDQRVEAVLSTEAYCTINSPPFLIPTLCLYLIRAPAAWVRNALASPKTVGSLIRFCVRTLRLSLCSPATTFFSSSPLASVCYTPSYTYHTPPFPLPCCSYSTRSFGLRPSPPFPHPCTALACTR